MARAPVMGTFNFFASDFTLINEIKDITGTDVDEIETPMYQPEKWPFDA
jgi:hypothetical protein